MAKANLYGNILINESNFQDYSSVDYIKKYLNEIKNTLNDMPSDYSKLSPWELDESVATLELVIDKLFFMITDLKSYQ